ncbi:MAG: hypothetical protein KKD86_15160 [Bacteroidetes bacterium]|nr:hypothetical protein [Bacteroidota bacterium]
MDYYDIDDNNMDKALKAFYDDISSDPNEYGMIEISIINEDPQISANIANYIVHLVDSVNIKINIERARNNRIFIEKRYSQNVDDLRKSENSLYKFQKKYGIVAVPEQLEVTIKAAAEIEAALFKIEVEAFLALQQFGEHSPQYQGVKAEMELLNKKVQELKNSSDLSEHSNILFPFKKMPEIAIGYLRVYREVEIQQSILEIVMPMYEQAKVEEQKSFPTIIIIDEAVPAQLKYSPKRSVIVVGVLFLLSFLLIPFIFVGEKAINRKSYENPLQMKEANFMRKLIKVYKMKL